ncbi:MAG: plasmid pRiA4b ORF-3 family protein [Bacteroidetes bacterium]|nr:plasmid pRiA4b ORF-3 family protein [Bacteroidota bacterium]
MANTLYLRIEIDRAFPAIWREFYIPDTYRMDRFHQVIQIVMGWENAHLHEFEVNDVVIGMIDEFTSDSPRKTEDETAIYLSDLDLSKGDVLTYMYDFGDSWLHKIEILDITDGEVPDPHCTKGEKACPPEDCGGIWGYSELLKELKEGKKSDIFDFEGWLDPEFDPDFFPQEAINKELLKFSRWHKKHPREKSTPWHQLD